MIPVIHPRSETFGAAEIPRSSNGATRALLPTGCDGVTIHWVGAGTFADPNDTRAELRSIHYNHAIPTGKPWEYNYVVDASGDIWEYAGEYVSAHSLGENGPGRPAFIGILVLLGTADANDPAIYTRIMNAIAFLIAAITRTVPAVNTAVLETARLRLPTLKPGYAIRAHRDMPGANTTCPGPLTESIRLIGPALARLISPATAQPPTPTPTATEPTTMPTLIAYRDLRYSNVFILGLGTPINATGKMLSAITEAGHSLILVEDQHDQALASILGAVGYPVAGYGSVTSALNEAVTDGFLVPV